MVSEGDCASAWSPFLYAALPLSEVALSEVLAGGAFGYYRWVDPNYSRTNPNAPAPGLGLPVSMGPIALPKPPPHKLRWGRLFLWTVLVFAGGVAVGFVEKDSLVKAGEEIGVHLGSTTAPPSSAATPSASQAASSSPSAVAPKPEPAAAAVPPSAAPVPAPASAPRPVVNLADPPSPEPAKAAHVTSHSARPEPATEALPVASAKHGKGAAKDGAKDGATASSPSHKPRFDEPFADESGSAPAPKPAASPSRKTVEAAAAKSEPSKTSAKSSDSLDNLMADSPSDGKGKKRENKDIDALLKDVQKPRAEPAPKKAAPASAPSLSAADIARVMNGVKTRSKECANKLAQKGVAELKITVGKSGAVSDVHLGGQLVNTPVGACIEKVTRAAVFPPSSGLVFDYRVDAR